MIRIKNITKRLGNFELANISLDIPRGEYVVLLGDSGSGKSVLLEILAGLIAQDQGEVWIGDVDLTACTARHRKFGMVFQDLALFPHLTVRENIAYPLKISRMRDGDIDHRVNELAARLEIAQHLNRYPMNLSGGEKQRVGIARTLAAEPDCLLLDEPLTGVDARIRKEIKSVLRNLNRDGQTIIHVTHDYEEAISLASSIGILEGGILSQYGLAGEVLRNPTTPFLASFTGIRNFIPVRLAADPVDGRMKAWTDQHIPLIFTTEKTHGEGFLIIPEDAVILSVDAVATSAANQLPGIILDIIPSNHGFEVVLDVGFRLLALVTPESLERLSMKRGDSIYAGFKASALKYINK